VSTGIKLDGDPLKHGGAAELPQVDYEAIHCAIHL
jgi:hypothetical protein